MFSIRRSGQLALRNTNNGFIAIGSRRAFSRTSARSRGALPVYLESSKPALSRKLAEVNSKILLLKHLTPQQEKLVYRESNRAKLEAEPIDITLGEVTLQLEHIDRTKLPPRSQSIIDICILSESREDWENVVRMLEGFENAGIKLLPSIQAMVMRKLNLHNQQQLILKALQRPKATGVRMREWPVMIQVLRSAIERPALADWQAEETADAFRFAKQIVELLEDKEHCGAYPLGDTPSPHDFRGTPAVIAVPTSLAAALALRHDGDAEEVKKWAGRLVVAMKQRDYNKFLDDAAEKFAASESSFHKIWHQATYVNANYPLLLEIAWVATALRASSKLLGSEMPHAEEAAQFESRATKIEGEGCDMVDRLRTRERKTIAVDWSDITEKLRAL